MGHGRRRKGLLLERPRQAGCSSEPDKASGREYGAPERALAAPLGRRSSSFRTILLFCPEALISVSQLT